MASIMNLIWLASPPPALQCQGALDEPNDSVLILVRLHGFVCDKVTELRKTLGVFVVRRKTAASWTTLMLYGAALEGHLREFRLLKG